MSRLISALLMIVAACCLMSSRPLNAEDGGNELERMLGKKCAEVSIALIESRMKLPPDSPQLQELTQLLAHYREALEREHMTSREMVHAHLKEAIDQIEKEIQTVKMAGKEGGDFSRLQFFEQVRAALMKKLIEMDVGPLQFADDAQKALDKFNKNAPQMSKLHLKMANGNELDAEGPFLQGPLMQQLPEIHDVLEQFADAAKDGAVSFRLPEPFDLDMAKELIEMVKKVAPKVEITGNEKMRILVATSDDPVQLRRAATIFRSLRPNNPGFDPNQKMKGDFNPGMKGQFDGNDMKRFQPPVQPPKVRPGMEDMKKKKDAIDDKF